MAALGAGLPVTRPIIKMVAQHLQNRSNFLVPVEKLSEPTLNMADVCRRDINRTYCDAN